MSAGAQLHGGGTAERNYYDHWSEHLESDTNLGNHLESLLTREGTDGTVLKDRSLGPEFNNIT